MDRLQNEANAYPKQPINELNNLAYAYSQCEEPLDAASSIGALERKRNELKIAQLNKDLYDSYWQ